MAIESVVADPGVGGSSFAVDTITGGVAVPYVKLMSGTDASEELLPGTAADGLLVNLGANNDVTVTGSVTANAGTNLNTSALALEAGGNLAGAATSLAVMDDWDEADRAKVNVIVGQAGIAGGTGTDGATVPRVTLATNVALPAGTNAIGKLAANSGVDIGDVDVTSISAGTNTIGGVTPRPETTGGLSISRDIDLDNGTLTVVKASAGQLYGFTITNRGTVPIYAKFYDAASGTLGTGTPVMTIEVPSNASDHTTLAQSFGGMGIAFATGICVGAGTGIADADNTDPGANIVISNVYYK